MRHAATGIFLLLAGTFVFSCGQADPLQGDLGVEAVFPPSTELTDRSDAPTGASVIVCNQSVTLVDFYEAIQRYHVTPSLGADALPASEKVAMALDSIAVLDPDRADLLRSYYAEFWPNAQILTNAYLPRIPDDDPLSLPGPDCDVQQLVFRRMPNVPGEKLYNINGRLWDALDATQQAMTILHEIMHREHLARGVTSSARARYYNAIVSANLVPAMDLPSYADFLERAIGLAATRQIRGVLYALSSLEADSAGRVLSASPRYGDSVALKFDRIMVMPADRVTFYPDYTVKALSPLTRAASIETSPHRGCGLAIEPAAAALAFAPNGALERLTCTMSSCQVRQTLCRADGTEIGGLALEAADFAFTPAGMVTGGMLLEDAILVLPAGTVIAAHGNAVAMHATGIPEQVTTAKDAVLVFAGEKQLFLRATTVRFDETGTVANGPLYPPVDCTASAHVTTSSGTYCLDGAPGSVGFLRISRYVDDHLDATFGFEGTRHYRGGSQNDPGVRFDNFYRYYFPSTFLVPISDGGFFAPANMHALTGISMTAAIYRFTANGDIAWSKDAGMGTGGWIQDVVNGADTITLNGTNAVGDPHSRTFTAAGR